MERRQFLSAAGGLAALSPGPVRAGGALPGLCVGEGVADITPPLGFEMGGFHRAPGKERRIEAIRQTCEVRALLLSFGATQVVICSIDTLECPRRMVGGLTGGW